MVKKKNEEVDETTVETLQAGHDAAIETKPADDAPVEVAAEGTAVEATSAENTAAIEAAPAAEEVAPVAEKPKKEKKAAAPATEKADGEGVQTAVHKRAEKVGIVTSDKMTNTVVVRGDRLCKHPIYRKYVKKRKKFMAHDVMGANIGDKVKIVETRPLSARKRWRVVEIIQKAQS